MSMTTPFDFLYVVCRAYFYIVKINQKIYNKHTIWTCLEMREYTLTQFRTLDSPTGSLVAIPTALQCHFVNADACMVLWTGYTER